MMLITVRYRWQGYQKDARKNLPVVEQIAIVSLTFSYNPWAMFSKRLLSLSDSDGGSGFELHIQASKDLTPISRLDVSNFST